MYAILDLPPLEVLLDRFDYNPETGVLTHKNPKSNGVKADTVAGYLTGQGWLRVKVDDRHYRVARIVWKMYHGGDPPKNMVIDHINRVRTDNRIENLRCCTFSENVKNSYRKPARPKTPPLTPEELAEIRREAAKKLSKRTRVVHPDGTVTQYKSRKEAALCIGCANSTMTRMCNEGVTWNGFTASLVRVPV
jgi:hypothetical protein